jgi:hypothetical protein
MMTAVKIWCQNERLMRQKGLWAGSVANVRGLLIDTVQMNGSYDDSCQNLWLKLHADLA